MGKVAEISEVDVSVLVPYARNAKKHGRDQVEKLKRSIEEFGFLSPCLIDRDMNIIAGHGRVLAAKELGMLEVPCVYVEGLTEEQRRAYILADNRLTELGGWDEELVVEELRDLFDSGFSVELTGFQFDDEPSVSESGAEGAEINSVAALPPSRVYIFSVSAFGTNSERFVEFALTEDEAERFIADVKENGGAGVEQRLREVLNV